MFQRPSQFGSTGGVAQRTEPRRRALGGGFPNLEERSARRGGRRVGLVRRGVKNSTRSRDRHAAGALRTGPLLVRPARSRSRPTSAWWTSETDAKRF